ncbi:LamG-like jellyroll fold domain-containing protein [Streptomyces sp. S.PB5]|uniref:LamG-like jellyroll fold domain-containing protein n=1 Tax=Streptomyces sp. S.PB5 TaxID=3020844 RepID=UPI0025B2283A|nr:LamG-like jellyroll fold domain-containing protein [Streptomyces sp. S.PB5]MDN3024439.1 LamG domain-containing protein [Streptomyces sp. S.PB5]
MSAVAGLTLLAGMVPVFTGMANAAPQAQQEAPQGDASAKGTENAAFDQAARSGAKVEITSLRGESSETYALPNGNFEAVEHLRPVRARVDGEWKAINTALEKRADGSVGPKVALVGIAFSGGGKEQPLITLERAGRKLSLSWPTALPEPVINGATATYPSVLEGVDLQVKADVDSASQVLIVKTPEAAANPKLAELRLAMDADGMDVRTTAGGGLAAVDKGAGGPVFEAPRPMMWDSSKGASARAARTAVGSLAKAGGPSHGPGESAKVAPIGVSVPSGDDALVLKPDQELLKSATFPVYIDPQWYSPKAGSWTFVSRYWASSPQWKFNGNSDSGMGYCAGDARCAPEDVKRVFYTVPTSRFAGKSILSAEFVVNETHSYSCTKTDVQLWRTKGINSSTTWNTQTADGFWADLQKTQSEAKGWSSDCPGGTVEFWALRAVQQAAANGWSTTTFGLKARDENDVLSWKRFSDDAWLRVQYNRPPTQIRMSQLTQDPGGACSSTPKRVRILPTIRANSVTDPDGDDIAVQFQASWDTGDGKGYTARWTSARTTYKKSGSPFSISLPAGIPKDKAVGWHVRSYDSAQWSPWSNAGSATDCLMVYDRGVPAGPSIVSTQYPPSDSEDPNDPWLDGVGRYGTFTIDSSSTDVSKYWFGINGDPTSAHTLTTSGGAAQTTRFMPTKSGVNFITAQAFDAAGNGSEIRTYQFRVNAGQPDRLNMKLDESAGSTTVSGVGGEWSARLNGATPGGEGVLGHGLQFDGTDDYAATTSPVLNTRKSFSVSLWAKLGDINTATGAVAVAQGGANATAYELYYSPSRNGWVFARHTEDTADTTASRAMQPACATGDTQCSGARLGVWTHVVGVFDNPSSQVKLYVDGALVGTAAYSSLWDGRGRTMLGATDNGGALNGFFRGSIDEVQFFDYPLANTQISRLYAKQSVDTDRPAKVIWPLDEEATATAAVGRSQKLTATVNGGAVLGSTGVDGTAATFDGVDDGVITSRPVLDTYQSFAVSAWARLPKDKESRAMMAVTQGGTSVPGFELVHSSALGGWVFLRAGSDSTSATLVRARQNACDANVNCAAARLGEWTHVVGVYDYDAGEIRLYVDGVLKDTQPFTTPWLATGPVTLGYKATGGAQALMKGDLDDVRLFDRALSGDEVKELNKARPVVQGRWKLDSGSGTPLTSADDSSGNRALTLSGNASIDTSGNSNYVGTGGLLLDGSGDYAATATSPVSTGTSFTAAAWVSTAARPDHPVTVFSQAGLVNSGFAVRYVPSATDPVNAGRWQLAMPGSDVKGTTVAAAEHPNFMNNTSWNHLAVVYDAFADQMRLYVDGNLEQVVCADSNEDGSPDVEGCTDSVSWNSNVLPFNATAGLQLGRGKTDGTWGEYWPGVIDDVWTFQGVASDEQIARLANGTDVSTVPGP